MAPPRKRPELRQRSNTRDLELVGDTLPTPPAPHPKDGRLLDETVDAWGLFWQSDVAQLVTKADMPPLRRLFRMYDERERLHRLLLAEPFTQGSTGQVVAHPADGMVNRLDGRIKDLEDRFGLSPKARLNLGITLGAAAKSLEALNRDFDAGDDEPDPRLQVIDIEA